MCAAGPIHVPGRAAHIEDMSSNVIPFRPKRQHAGVSVGGEKVGGQFASPEHEANDSVVLSAPPAPQPAETFEDAPRPKETGGPLRTIPESLRMSYSVEDETLHNLGWNLGHRARAIHNGYRPFAAELDCPEDESARLYRNAISFADDFDSLEAACHEAAAHTDPSRRTLVARRLETQVLAAVADADDDEYPRRGFMDALPFLDREEAAQWYSRAKTAQANGGNWEGIYRQAAQKNAAAHPGGPLAAGYTPPGGTVQDGYGQGHLSTGSNYTGFMDATEVAKNVREELKRAQEANYLPAGVSFSVTRDKFAGGQAVRVSVRGIPDADRRDPVETNHWGEPADRAEAKELDQRVKSITNAWNRQDVDTDYYNVSYYGTVDIETDQGRAFREREAAEQKARKDARRAKAS